jgi:hypothetical protein
MNSIINWSQILNKRKSPKAFRMGRMGVLQGESGQGTIAPLSTNEA